MGIDWSKMLNLTTNVENADSVFNKLSGKGFSTQSLILISPSYSRISYFPFYIQSIKLL